MKYTTTLLSNFQVIKLKTTANNQEEANKKAIKEAELMGFTNLTII